MIFILKVIGSKNTIIIIIGGHFLYGLNGQMADLIMIHGMHLI